MTPPWVTLRQLRKAAGLTQVELADGIVTQSMLCHIERGRVIPSEATLTALLCKLNAKADEHVDEWRRWRMRGRARDRLWIALILDDAPLMAQLLEESGGLLVPFERHAYAALRAALAASWQEADEGLQRAAADARPHLRWHPSSGAQSERQGAVDVRRQRRDVYAGAWTQIDKARALVAESKAWFLLSTHFGKGEAALYWKQTMAERLWDTIWKGA